ncbi:MAG: hypothetical protein PHS07_02035 [Patescibacteria group bacterium]|nr:hypothetical protein [Patescibacteria group bacterium]
MKYFIKRSEIKSEIKNVSLWNRIQANTPPKATRLNSVMLNLFQHL